MAYVVTNPPQLVMGTVGGTGSQVWSYISTDVSTDVDASGYITDGGKRGMRVGDMVIVRDSDTGPVTTVHTVVSVSATYPGAVDLANAFSGTNSD